MNVSIAQTLEIAESKGIMMKLYNERKITIEEYELVVETISKLENELIDLKQENIKIDRENIELKDDLKYYHNKAVNGWG